MSPSLQGSLAYRAAFGLKNGRLSSTRATEKHHTESAPGLEAINHSAVVWRCITSWLRTMNPGLPPSKLVVAATLRSILPEFLSSSLLDTDIRKILKLNRTPPITTEPEECAA